MFQLIPTLFTHSHMYTAPEFREWRQCIEREDHSIEQVPLHTQNVAKQTLMTFIGIA
jgi:hypothetical protein